MTAQPTRRLVLAAVAGGSLTLAGCRGLDALGPVPGLAPDVVTLDHAITAEELMVVTYRAALGALAGTHRATTVVTDLLAEHEAHLAQLRSRLILPRRPSTASPSPNPAPPTLGTGRRQVIGQLIAAEHAAATRLLRQLIGAPPALAQLMASIGASEAAHAVILGQPGLA